MWLVWLVTEYLNSRDTLSRPPTSRMSWRWSHFLTLLIPFPEYLCSYNNWNVPFANMGTRNGWHKEISCSDCLWPFGTPLGFASSLWPAEPKMHTILLQHLLQQRQLILQTVLLDIRRWEPQNYTTITCSISQDTNVEVHVVIILSIGRGEGQSVTACISTWWEEWNIVRATNAIMCEWLICLQYTTCPGLG